MSRNRLIARIRRNPDYEVIARHLDDLRLDHRVAYPNGRVTGHPAVFVTLPDGREVHFTVASTPMPGINKAACLRRFKNFLRDHGVMD